MRRAMKAVDVASSKVKKWQPEAHAAAINALQPLAENLVASGDDDGCIKLWDPRQPEASRSFSEHTDFIADFAYQVRKCCLPKGSRLPASVHQFFPQPGYRADLHIAARVVVTKRTTLTILRQWKDLIYQAGAGKGQLPCGSEWRRHH